LDIANVNLNTGGFEVKILIGVEGKRDIGEYSMIAPRDWKLYQLKEEVCKVINHDPQQARFKRTNFWSQPTKLFDDENKTIEEWKISNGEVLWLEGGKAPYKGQIEVIIDAYTCFILDKILEEGSIYSPLLHISSHCKLAVGGRDYKISKVQTLDFSCFKTLLELKTHLLEYEPFQTVPSPLHIRLWQNERILKRNESTLRKHNIHTDCRFTVQVLDYPDPLSEGNANGSLLYIHKRDSQNKRFIQLGEFVWSNGVTLEDLLLSLAQLSDIPVETMLFSTYELYYDRWIIFYNGIAEPDRIRLYLENKEKEIEEAKKTKKKRTIKKLHIKDGTVICLKDMRDDPFNQDDFAITQEAAQIFINATDISDPQRGNKPRVEVSLII